MRQGEANRLLFFELLVVLAFVIHLILKVVREATKNKVEEIGKPIYYIERATSPVHSGCANKLQFDLLGLEPETLLLTFVNKRFFCFV